MNAGFQSEYERRFSTVLQTVATSLEEHLAQMTAGSERIDRISARAKSPDRFLKKALKEDDDGRPKYLDPINEIQDQIGARITVFYLQDVERIKKIALKYLTAIEVQKKEPSADAEFGYFGEHFVMKIPDDVVPHGEEDNIPEFFELQIKTLFQHAWSEADHDLGYKSVRDLSSSEKRRIGFTAAQSWGADHIFSQLADALVFANENDIPDETSGAAV